MFENPLFHWAKSTEKKIISRMKNLVFKIQCSQNKGIRNTI